MFNLQMYFIMKQSTFNDRTSRKVNLLVKHFGFVVVPLLSPDYHVIGLTRKPNIPSDVFKYLTNMSGVDYYIESRFDVPCILIYAPKAKSELKPFTL